MPVSATGIPFLPSIATCTRNHLHL
uniref:Uncharacterized protein n=1 Tax=Arundo donax TaxID=35708 RepID=A0A0A8YCM0_ARUDO